jgi:hypothetical protein
VAGALPACCKGVAPWSDELVVDPKTKGVRWAFVWLMDEGKDFKKPLPIHPDLNALKKKEVVIDQPCCTFEPHAVGLWQGQTFVGKNSAPFAHNMNIFGGNARNPQLNNALAAGASFKEKRFVADPKVVSVSCNVHPWMKAWLGVFNHPYFAVTDEKGEFEIKNPPAGRYRLVVWQEAAGWVTGEKAPDKNGTVIEIKPDAVTDLGTIPFTVR